MKRLILLAVLALPLAAQQRFTASTGTVSLVAAATAVTVQQPATATNPAPNAITLESAVVYCSVACVVSQSQNGTAATATAGTVTAISPVGPASTANVFTASNVGAGTTVPPALTVAAGATVVIDLSKIALPRGGNKVNYTVSVAAITGDANITLTWKENAQ